MRYAVVIAGGSGTRLWPLSRERQPKQLLPLFGGLSLLEISCRRVAELVPPAHLLVCAGEAHRRRIRELVGIGEEQFLGEPTGRDTLPALAFSAAAIARRDPEAVMGVFTADHLIEPEDQFRAAVRRGYELVENQRDLLVTFGVPPTDPATGFGYLELGEAMGADARRVRRFKEKPDEATARRYVAAGPDRYLWNSGMFVWSNGTFLSRVADYEPELHRSVQRIAEAWGSPECRRLMEELYPGLKRISVDFGVMERASTDPAVRVAAIPLALVWRDIGSWSAYADACPRDASGNALAAPRHELLECRDNLIVSEDPEHLIAVLGCSDLVIVHTPDATLVCPRERVQDIKSLQALIRDRHGSERV